MRPRDPQNICFGKFANMDYRAPFLKQSTTARDSTQGQSIYALNKFTKKNNKRTARLVWDSGTPKNVLFKSAIKWITDLHFQNETQPPAIQIQGHRLAH